MEFSNLHFGNNSFKEFLNCIQDKNVVLFGAGHYGKLALDDLSSITQISYFIDNDPWKWDTTIHGIDVRPPSYLLNKEMDKAVVLIASLYVFEAEELLIEMGVKHYFSYVLFFDRAAEKMDRIGLILPL